MAQDNQQSNWSESELTRDIFGEPDAETPRPPDDVQFGSHDPGSVDLPGLESSWTRPETLPDLHGVDLAAIDSETNDARLRADLGPGHAMHDGYIVGVSVAYRVGGELRSLYVPIRHPETDNFDPQQVFAWLRHITATVPVV